MTLIAVHVESQNCQPALAFDILAELERTIRSRAPHPAEPSGESGIYSL